MKEPIAIWRAFERNVQADPGATALSTLGGPITREMLATRASALAHAMRGAGVGEESVVTLMLPNSVEFVAAFLAVMQLPAIAALASTRYKASELRAICADVQPASILATEGDADDIAEMLDVARQHEITVPGSTQRLRLLFLEKPSAGDRRERRRFHDAGTTPALIKFTSGSTGALKSVLWTAANVEAEAVNVVETLGLDASDSVLAPVPLSHSYGFDLGVLPLVFAGTSLLLRTGFAPKNTLADLTDEGPSVFLGVPGMYRVLHRTRLESVPDLSSVRHLLSCTAPLPVALIEAFARRFNAPICQHYGSSETGGITVHERSEIMNRPASVGRAMRNVTLRILDRDGKPLPPGQRGEVVVGGDAIAANALMGDTIAGDPPAGEYWTGDTGFLDPDGYLYLDGSRNGVINVGGLKVSPAEVAKTLESHEAVREAAVIAVKDPQGEDVVTAAVTLHGAAEEAELLAFCLAQIADYKVPRRIHVLEELPRDASGEITLRVEDLPR